jgi:hypothetical protein
MAIENMQNFTHTKTLSLIICPMVMDGLGIITKVHMEWGEEKLYYNSYAQKTFLGTKMDGSQIWDCKPNP